MNEQRVSVGGPIEIKSHTPERVAFELMDLVSRWENAPEETKRTREYWLDLYYECHSVVTGSKPRHMRERERNI